MALLNETYEVPSNPELHAQFDKDEDPMDRIAQQGGNPFAGFQSGGWTPVRAVLPAAARRTLKGLCSSRYWSLP